MQKLIVLTLALLLLAPACSSSSNSVKNTADATNGADSDVSDPNTPVVSNENFSVIFQYRKRFDQADGIRFFQVKSDGTGLVDLTPSGADCGQGCALSPDAKWMIQISGATTKGSTISLYAVANNRATGGTELSKTALDWHFEGSYLYFNTRNDKSFDFFRVTLGQNATPQKIGTFTPSSADRYRGTFTVRSNNIIVLFAQLAGIEVHHLVVGGDFKKIDVQIGTTTGGTGSEFSERDPVAISPNGSAAVLFTQTTKETRVWLLSLTSSTHKNMALTLNHLQACDQKDTGYYQVVNRPAFSADGRFIFFMATSKDHADVTRTCAGYTSKDWQCFDRTDIKPETDIFRVSVFPLLPDSIRNITANAKNDSPQNLNVQEFRLSPLGNFVVFVGTPSDGGNCRGHDDREVWKIGIDGTLKLQLTDDSQRYAIGETLTTN